MHVNYLELKLSEEILILGIWYVITSGKQNKYILAMVGFIYLSVLYIKK